MNKTELIQQLSRVESAFASGRIFKQLGNNRHHKNCWEIKNCSNKRCSSYGLHNHRCWHRTGTFCCAGGRLKDFAQKWQDCRNCIVFKACTPTEHSRLVEMLNNILFSAKQFIVSSQNRLSQNELSCLAHKFKLSGREKQVFRLLLERLSRKEISASLYLSDETIKMHIASIYRKTAVKGRANLFKKLSKGLVCNDRNYLR